jgi:hypothetical protein
MRDSWRAHSWADKVRVWFRPPGWRANDVALKFPKPAFELSRVQVYDPVVSRGASLFAAAQFTLLLSGVSAVLWFADVMPLRSSAVWTLALVTGYWVVGALLQGRITVLEALMIDCAAMATVTSALGLLDLHYAFKPLTMAIAIIFVATYAYSTRSGGRFGTYFHAFLTAALTCSLLGDVFLMLPGNYFIPGCPATGSGLAGRRASALPRRGCMPCCEPAPVLWCAAWWRRFSDDGLRLRAGYDPAGRPGRGVFMLSDSLIANKFCSLFRAPLWILASYYAAQLLIVHNVCRTQSASLRHQDRRTPSA